MRKRLLIATGAVTSVVGLSASSAMAAPPDRVDGDKAFVCPVLKVSDQAVESSGKFTPLGDTGDYTTLPGNAGHAETFNGNVPLHATNGDGAGTPGANHVTPGDEDQTGYTAIWSGN
jgi:hypothetical protein